MNQKGHLNPTPAEGCEELKSRSLPWTDSNFSQLRCELDVSSLAYEERRIVLMKNDFYIADDFSRAVLPRLKAPST